METLTQLIQLQEVKSKIQLDLSKALEDFSYKAIEVDDYVVKILKPFATRTHILTHFKKPDFLTKLDIIENDFSITNWSNDLEPSLYQLVIYNDATIAKEMFTFQKNWYDKVLAQHFTYKPIFYKIEEEEWEELCNYLKNGYAFYLIKSDDLKETLQQDWILLRKDGDEYFDQNGTNIWAIDIMPWTQKPMEFSVTYCKKTEWIKIPKKVDHNLIEVLKTQLNDVKSKEHNYLNNLNNIINPIFDKTLAEIKINKEKLRQLNKWITPQINSYYES